MEKLQSTAYKQLIVISKNKKLLGSLTDGDIRRALLKGSSISDKIEGIFNNNPIYLLGKNLVAVC